MTKHTFTAILDTLAQVGTLKGNSFFDILTLSAYDNEIIAFKKDVEGKAYSKNVFLDSNVLGATPTINSVKVVLSMMANDVTGNATTMNVSSKGVAAGESMNPASLDNSTGCCNANNCIRAKRSYVYACRNICSR